MLSCALHNLGGGFGFVMLMRVVRAKPAVTTGRAAPLPYFRASTVQYMLYCSHPVSQIQGSARRTDARREEEDARRPPCFSLPCSPLAP